MIGNFRLRELNSLKIYIFVA